MHADPRRVPRERHRAADDRDVSVGHGAGDEAVGRVREARAPQDRPPVPLDELEGRVTSILLTPYPPGIPLLIPGERFNKTIVNYLRFARDFNERFPGFHTDIHGLVAEELNGRVEYFVDCVRD
ncbi:Lysine decarboxylase [Burkholderia dolosa AU0158]|nr:Lysine decarboxylase [Burkholderia dolosa AU0158]